MGFGLRPCLCESFLLLGVFLRRLYGLVSLFACFKFLSSSGVSMVCLRFLFPVASSSLVYLFSFPLLLRFFLDSCWFLLIVGFYLGWPLSCVVWGQLIWGFFANLLYDSHCYACRDRQLARLAQTGVYSIVYYQKGSFLWFHRPRRRGQLLHSYPWWYKITPPQRPALVLCIG